MFVTGFTTVRRLIVVTAVVAISSWAALALLATEPPVSSAELASEGIRQAHQPIPVILHEKGRLYLLEDFTR